ncbi:MAG: PHP domain-containing protein, partial [Clostridia bacterium]|nr:PHP domain-containing protein [Clostridia bacterium]
MAEWFKYDLHVHCAECSACGQSTAHEMLQAFYEAGYAGYVMTDHSVTGSTAAPHDWPWEKQVGLYYETYLKTKEEADRLGMDLLFGWEHHYGHGKEVLTYGIDLVFLLQNPDIPSLSLREYVERVHAYGGYIAQAHPYRDRGYIDMSVQPQPEYLDAVEVYNPANLPGENAKAMLLALAHGLQTISGSDNHGGNQLPRVG